jgi:hypothetical protein
MAFIVLGYFIVYGLLGFVLIRQKPFVYNLLDIKLHLLPIGYKWFGIGMGILTLVLGIIFWGKFEFERELFFYHIDLCLLLIAFSKEYSEDELISSIRFKAMIVSFISMGLGILAVFPLYLFYSFQRKIWYAQVSIPLVIGAILSMYLFYFYYTRIKLNNNTE